MAGDDHEPIAGVVRDYFEGWFEADTARMDRALHPDLVKRGPGGVTTTKARMVELTAAGEGRADAGDGTLEITVADVRDDIASVTVRAGVYHQYLHLVRTDEGWRIANALWRYR